MGTRKQRKPTFSTANSTADMRELAALLSSSDMVDQYLEVEDWRVKENSNMSYSLQGLNNYLSSTVIAKVLDFKNLPSKHR